MKLPKKGDLTCAGIWRGIKLLSIPGKIMAKIIISPLRDQLDAKLRREQAGYNLGRADIHSAKAVPRVECKLVHTLH